MSESFVTAKTIPQTASAQKIGAGYNPRPEVADWICDKPDSVFQRRSTLSLGGDYSSGNQVTLALKQSYPEALCWSHRSFFARKLGTNAPLFDLAPRRVWLFSLQRLPFGFPFPAVGSMPWTFSLFHCSSSYDGGSLTPALPYGVRTFLNISRPIRSCPHIGSKYRNRLQILERDHIRRHASCPDSKFSVGFFKFRAKGLNFHPADPDRSLVGQNWSKIVR
jgi:hypothetical protein